MFNALGKGPSLIQSHKPQTAAAAALRVPDRVTDRAGVQPVGCWLSYTHTELWPCSQTATCRPCLL